VRAYPGLRVPGALDPFELAVRAVLGQQVSVAAARTLAGRVAAKFGAPLGSLLLFPDAPALAAASEAEIAAIGLPRTRARTLRELARACAGGALSLSATTPLDVVTSTLQDLPGVGPWTAQYIAMRALRHPDAFPAGDLGVRKALGGATESRVRARAEPWRPWRAYAVMHLWNGDPT
jgi:AraC family transcriptional regulator of adaptative response / DNA-3-methyladenine glycosylase II